MNRYLSHLAALLLAVSASSVAAASAGERLVSPALPNFVVGHSASKYAKSIREEIPRGETMENWTKRITTQWFKGLATRVSPAKYASNVMDGLPRACPGATASPVETMTLGGWEAARFKVTCPKGTGGQPESFILLAIAGKRDMHVKQVAFRGQATAEDFLWGRKFLDGVVLCRAKSTAPACN